MGLKEMQINFDNPWATYNVGDTVNGELLLTLDAPKKVRDITVKIKGEAQVSWSELETERDSEGKEVRRNVEYTASENYFENKFDLLASGESETEIPPGAHVYKFSCILPNTLPSSFESEFGYVRYTVKATLNRPWKFDQDCKAAFTVISPLDLNKTEEAKKPINLEQEKFVGICCCRSGPLKASLDVPVSGFVSGQTIPVNVEVENMTDKDVTSGKCILRKVVTYKSTTPTQNTKVIKVNITDITLSVLGAHSSNKWTEKLVVPALPPSNLNNCKIIDVNYELKNGGGPVTESSVKRTHGLEVYLSTNTALELKVPGIFNRTLNIRTPVIFGTVPIINYQQPTQPVAPPPDAKGSPSGDIGWSAPTTGPKNSLYPDLPPPTYVESVFGGSANIRDPEDSEHTQISAGWIPRYPTYNFAPSAPVQS